MKYWTSITHASHSIKSRNHSVYRQLFPTIAPCSSDIAFIVVCAVIPCVQIIYNASVSAKNNIISWAYSPRNMQATASIYFRQIFCRCAKLFSPLENTQPERDPAIPSGVRQVPALSDGCQKARLIRAHADAQMSCESQRVSQRQRRVGRSPIEISGWGGAGSVYSLFL